MRMDALIAGVLLVSATLLGTGYVRTLRDARLLPDVTGLEQQTFGAAVMNICGRGLKTPVVPMTTGPDTPPSQRALIEFLTQRRDRIACDDIPADVPAEAGALQETSRYLVMLCELPWRIGGLSWAAFDWLLGAMFAVTIAFAYLAGRVIMRRAAAAAVAAAYMLSPMHLTNVVDVRDYSKAPFFAATLFLVALVIVFRWRPAVVLGLAALAGLVLGLGFGMRTDVALNLPLVWAALAIFLPQPLAASWKLRVGAVAVTIVAFVAAASPILASRQSGGFIWHWALLGFGHEFDRELGVDRAPYETGYFYDDSYVAATVDAYGWRTTRMARSTQFDTARYAQLSRGYYQLLVRTFPADVFLRAEAAAIKVLGLPFRSHRLAHPDRLPRVVSTIIDLRSRLLSVLGYAGVPLFAVVVLATSLRSARFAAALMTIVALLGTSPAVQFQMRHYFHLELLSLALLGLCLQRPPLASGLGRAAAMRAGSFAVAALALTILPLLVLRLYQQRSASALLESYEHAELTHLPMRTVADDGGAVPLANASDILPADDGLRPMFSEQLVVETVASGCSSPRVSVTFKYAVATGFDYSRTFDMPSSGPTRTFFTVFHTATAGPVPHHFVFDRVEVPADQASCVASVSRFARPETFALLIPATLPPGWRDRPLHQTLRTWR